MTIGCILLYIIPWQVSTVLSRWRGSVIDQQMSAINKTQIHSTGKQLSGER